MRKKGAFSSSSLLVAFLASTVFLLLSFLPTFDLMERRFLDLSFRIRGPQNPHPEIVIVEIDDESLRRTGAWPWPRSFHAALLEILSQHPPSVIFYDMIFSEESRPEDDQAFAQQVRKTGNVVLPFYFAAQDPREFSESNAVYPLPLFAENAKQLGYVNIAPDGDGHVREIWLARSREGNNYLHVSLAVAALHEGYERKDLEPFLARKKSLINFPGPYQNFTRVPFDSLIEAHDSPDAGPFFKSFEGKVVLVGLTAAGTGMDLKATAFSPLYPGIGVQASMLHTILTGRFIERLPIPLHGLFLFLFACLILGLSLSLTPLLSLLAALGSFILLFGFTQLAFQRGGLWVPSFSFFALGALLYVGEKASEFLKIRFEREILSRELELASRIQKSFLPRELPKIPGLEVAAASFPAREVGGDLYDVLPLADGQWGLCVGDVSGKGVPAALFMAKALSEFRREAPLGPRTALERLNLRVAEDSSGGIFLTLLYVVVDPARERFVFANGGHEPMLFYEKSRGSIEFLSTRKGLPLGIVGGTPFDEEERTGKPGDILLLVSDGVKEARNERREMFGMERIGETLEGAASESPSAIVERLLARLKDFVGEAPPHDDLTFLCIKFV
jgi:serine phosphatase RsbU (regulator of sigma subunit)